METSRLKYNAEHPKKALNQAEYVERYSRRYPDISKSAKDVKEGRTIYEEPVYKPRTKAPVYEPDLRVPNVPKTRKKTEPTKPKTTIPSVNQGREYHKNTWEQSKSKSSKNRVTVPKTRRTQTLPRTKTTVPKVRTPRTKTKTSGRSNQS